MPAGGGGGLVGGVPAKRTRTKQIKVVKSGFCGCEPWTLKNHKEAAGFGGKVNETRDT